MQRDKPPSVSFRHFSEQLYCSGAVERLCALPDGTRELAGYCYWRNAGGRNVTSMLDEFDPEAAGAAGYRRFGPSDAAKCVAGRRMLLLGDSTTRDTYYELAATIGRPIWSKKVQPGWPESSWSPNAPATSSLAYDASGMCNGNEDLTPPWACMRDLWLGREAEPHVLEPNTPQAPRHAIAKMTTRLAYVYLMADWEWQWAMVKQLFKQRMPPPFGRERGVEPSRSPSTSDDHDAPESAPFDTIFVQCPMWTLYRPNAYNLSASHSARHKLVRPKNFSLYGQTCASIVDRLYDLSRSAGGRGVRMYMLGTAGLPIEGVKYPPDDEMRIANSLHRVHLSRPTRRTAP